MKCPKCYSSNICIIGYRQQLISIDDAVDIDMMLCESCGHEWDY